ncbi:hypothetical protein AHAS_Ahas14G0127100 [Arachis hypogaea]
MNGPLEQTRGNLEPSNSEDEDQFVSEEVERQEQKVPVTSEIAIKDEGHEPRILQSQKLLEVTMKHKDSNSHSSELKKKEERLREPPIQEALDEKKTPTITQPPRLGFKKVKAINKSTKKRIMTKLPRTIFMKNKGSTTSNPTPGPLASKFNQAMYKRKLADRKPRKGTIAETSPPLRARSPQPKALSEVSPSGDATLTKTLSEMTILLRQITQRQQIPQAFINAPPQPPRIEGPSRICGVCTYNTHYTNECPQLQEDTTLAVANPYP